MKAILAVLLMFTAACSPQDNEPDEWLPSTLEPLIVATPPPVKPDAGNQVIFLDDQMTVVLHNSLLELPKWPDYTVRPKCPYGQYQFGEGRAETGVPGSAYSFDGRGVRVKIDGSDAVAVPLKCGESTALLVLANRAGTLSPLDYLPITSGFDRYWPVEDGIAVEENRSPDESPRVNPERPTIYKWKGWGFQSDGAPQGFQTGIVRLSPLDLRLIRGVCGTGGIVSFFDDSGGTWGSNRVGDPPGRKAASLRADNPAWGNLRGMGSVSFWAFTLRCQEDGSPAVHHWVAVPVDGKVHLLVKAGERGVTGIQTYGFSAGYAAVIVETSTGTETWRFRYDNGSFVRTEQASNQG